MLRPIRQTKNTLKIDQYKIQLHKQYGEQQLQPLPLFVKSVFLATLQPSDVNPKKHPACKFKHLSQNHADECHCSRQQRHQSEQKKNIAFRIKRNFSYHKFLKSLGKFNQTDQVFEGSLNYSLNLDQKQRLIEGLMTTLKNAGTLTQKSDCIYEIKGQDLIIIFDYLIFVKKRKARDQSEVFEQENQDVLTSQLDDYMRSQPMKKLRTYMNCYDMFMANKEEKFERNKKLQQERRKKQLVLQKLQKKIDAKQSQLADLSSKITHFKAVFLQYQKKAFELDHYVNEKNQAYIKELCKQYQNHLQDTNSCTILIQTTQSRNNKHSSFQDIERNVKEQLKAVNDILIDGKNIQNQRTFLKNFLKRVMQYLRAKYTQLQKLTSQKTIWITELIKKMKELAQFNSFRHQFLQNLISQFTFTFLQAESKIKILAVSLEKQHKNEDLLAVLQQIQVHVLRMKQNYLLTNAFH